MLFRISRTSIPLAERPHWRAFLDNGVWFIDVSSLEDLLTLCEVEDGTQKDLVVASTPPSIELYDDYRE